MVTFTDAMTFHWNKQEIQVLHVHSAHTDGDSIIYFKEANVLHMGDTFFNGLYPFIDVDSGGSVDGMIAAADRALELADANTKIIPGHGPLAGVEDLRTYRGMLVEIRDQIRPLVDSGKSLEEVVAAKPTRKFDEKWGKGFINPEQMVKIVYTSFRNKK